MSRKKATRRVGSATKKRATRAAASKRSAATKSRAAIKRGAAPNKGAARRATKPVSPRGAAKKRGGARGAVRPAGRGSAAKKRARVRGTRPTLTLVKGKGSRGAKSRRTAPDLRAMPVAAAIDAETAGVEGGTQGSKQRVMLGLTRARAQLMAVLEGLGAVDAERPIAPGKWCTREIVLHLALRDRARIDEMEATLRGVPRSWMGFTVDDWKEQNARDLATVAHLDWAAALELLTATRQELIEALEWVPDEPAEVWSEVHTFGSMLMGLPPHDAHHGEQVRRWRAAESV